MEGIYKERIADIPRLLSEVLDWQYGGGSTNGLKPYTDTIFIDDDERFCDLRNQLFNYAQALGFKLHIIEPAYVGHPPIFYEFADRQQLEIARVVALKSGVLDRFTAALLWFVYRNILYITYKMEDHEQQFDQDLETAFESMREFAKWDAQIQWFFSIYDIKGESPADLLLTSRFATFHGLFFFFNSPDTLFVPENITRQMALSLAAPVLQEKDRIFDFLRHLYFNGYGREADIIREQLIRFLDLIYNEIIKFYSSVNAVGYNAESATALRIMRESLESYGFLRLRQIPVKVRGH